MAQAGKEEERASLKQLLKYIIKEGIANEENSCIKERVHMG
jgi:hypothetical protein